MTILWQTNVALLIYHSCYCGRSISELKKRGEKKKRKKVAGWAINGICSGIWTNIEASYSMWRRWIVKKNPGPFPEHDTRNDSWGNRSRPRAIHLQCVYTQIDCASLLLCPFDWNSKNLVTRNDFCFGTWKEYIELIARNFELFVYK